MTNQEIEQKLESLISKERRITREILQTINIAEDNKVHLEAGFDSIVKWLIVRFRLSEGAAHRRAKPASLIRAVPAADPKIQTGEVSLSTLSKTESVLRAEQKRTGKKISNEEKRKVVEAIQHCTQDQTEKKLAGLFPETMEQIERQHIRRVADNNVRMSLTFKDEDYEKILIIQDLLGHALPNADLTQVINHLAAYFLKYEDPKRESKVAESLRRQVIKRDHGKCQFVDPRTGHKCESKLRIEVDHIHPKALGGADELSNLRCLCRAHNSYRAEKTFGKREYAH